MIIHITNSMNISATNCGLEVKRTCYGLTFGYGMSRDGKELSDDRMYLNPGAKPISHDYCAECYELL